MGRFGAVDGGRAAITRFLGAMAVVGAIVPNVFVAVFAVRHGVDVGGYFKAWFGSIPASQLTVDLGICSIAFLGWAAFDGRAHGVRRWWVAVPATFAVGLCLAIPLYLWLRERAQAAGSAAGANTESARSASVDNSRSPAPSSGAKSRIIANP